MQGVLCKLDGSGHSVVAEWTTDDKLSQEKADAEFNRLVSEGHLLYVPSPEGKGLHTHIRRFDPEAETILASRQLVGG